MICALSVGGVINSCSGASIILFDAQPVANRVAAKSTSSFVFIAYSSEFTLSKAYSVGGFVQFQSGVTASAEAN
jgi:hypothetical protein